MQSIDFSTHGRDIDSVYKKIVTGDESISWAIFSPDSSNSYKPAEQGSGNDVTEFVENFNESRVEFGLARVSPPGSDVKKLLLIGWCPDSVPIRARSSFAQNFGTVAKILHGYHVQVTARDEDDLDPQDLLKKVSDAAGARYSIQTNGPSNFGSSSSVRKPISSPVSKPIAPKPITQKPKPFAARKPVVSGSIPQANQFIPKPIVPKPVAPVPTTPLFGAAAGVSSTKEKKINEDDGWDGAEEIEERDFTKKPLEEAKPAWKPIGKVDIDAIRSESKKSAETTPSVSSNESEPVAAPPKRSLPPRNLPPRNLPPKQQPKPEPVADLVSTKKESAEEEEDLDDEERAFREKRKLFDNPAPVEEPVVASKPKPITSSFKPSAASGSRPVARVPLPSANGFSSKPKSSGALENGKTPAQIWAEKRGKFDSSSAPEPPVSSAEVAEEEEPSVSELTSKFNQVDVEAEEEEEEEEATPSIQRPAPAAPIATATATRAVPPPPPAGASTSPTPVPLPPREPVVQKEVEEESEAEEEEEEEEEKEEKEAEPEAEQESASAIAQFDYKMQEEDEISLDDGELIVEIEFLDEDWWIGTNTKGERGQFPANFVKLVDGDSAAASATATGTNDEEVDENGYPVHTDKKAVALYNYEADEDNELSFKAGDIITDVYEYDEDWWYGTLNGERSLFPSNYVELQ
ncbi:Abp1 protein [Saccharomycopsis crataegensis]|uniref:Abp1 protein n=1 Tax=Saccharomycopsis crataegensis TaxID=43959 RepID=A0AAV5QGV5_9ASCO|nr:Abp1 protein [Saccharomycopsis crataegensis]